MSLIAVIDRERIVFAKQLAEAARTKGTRTISPVRANMVDGLVTISTRVGGWWVAVKFALPQKAWSNTLRLHLINLFSISADIAMRNYRGM